MFMAQKIIIVPFPVMEHKIIQHVRISKFFFYHYHLIKIYYYKQNLAKMPKLRKAKTELKTRTECSRTFSGLYLNYSKLFCSFDSSNAQVCKVGKT